MLQAFGKALMSYPLAEFKVEDSGDHLIIGTGELYLDSLMHDVRLVFTKELEVKVTEPFVKIAETVCDVSSI